MGKKFKAIPVFSPSEVYMQIGGTHRLKIEVVSGIVSDLAEIVIAPPQTEAEAKIRANVEQMQKLQESIEKLLNTGDQPKVVSGPASAKAIAAPATKPALEEKKESPTVLGSSDPLLNILSRAPTTLPGLPASAAAPPIVQAMDLPPLPGLPAGTAAGAPVRLA